MLTMDIFSTSYQQARQMFLQAARDRAAALESFVHPSIRGPQGEDLATDVAVLGSSDTGRILMIVSGTHGVEGYAGSGCQLHLLRSELLLEIAASTQIVLVHAMNPYGFAYDRRTNENNIDLNRNFVDFTAPLPINPNYLDYARQFLPDGNQLRDYQAAEARLDAAAEVNGGYQFFKKALQPGQYAHPEGLYYGGSGPCWSNQVFMQICRRYLPRAGCAAVLDVHTGLGPHGVGELIFMRQDAADKYAHLFSAPVSCAGGKASVSAAVKGPLVNAACDELRKSMAICFALEFGTVSVQDNTKAMIFENWTHRYLAPEDALYRESSRRLRNTYYCETPSWQHSVVERFSEIAARLHRCLLER